MAFVSVDLLYQRGKYILQHEGWLSFLKQGFSFVRNLFFSYGDYYIYERELSGLSETEFASKIPDATLKIVSTTQELEGLMVEGFDINRYFDAEELKLRINKGMILFCVFIGKNLAHRSFVAMNSKANVDPVLSRPVINWQNEASIGPCTTYIKYRGLNLYPYTLSQICRYLQRENKQNVKITTSKYNSSSIRGIEQAKFRICREARYLRLFHLKFWKEKPIKEIS